ncbi:fimbrial protein [Gallibacterium trehalosifermentans]|uniref:Fimbrial protein n=1 Tax=Gallibacterium trehalosifermentans TaxID=516935 RepID=A0ABV6GZR8_9PAST
MKKLILATLISAGVGFAAQSAMAESGTGATGSKQGGTIIFEGRIVETTCRIKDNEGNKRVTLPTVSTKAFSQAGSTAGMVPFTIDLEGCTLTGSGPKFIKAYFTVNEKVNAQGRIKNVYKQNTTATATEPAMQDTAWNDAMPNPASTLNDTIAPAAATGVDLQLLDLDGTTPLVITGDGHNTTGQAGQYVALPTNKLRYAVRYYATAASVTAGGVRGYVDYILSYK